MKEAQKFYRSEKYLVFLITLGIFGLSLLFQLTNIIIYTLSFLILLEIVRTIYEYVVAEEHKLYMRPMIDSGILFGLRELYVAWLMLKVDFNEGVMIMGVSMLAISVLLVFRHIVGNSAKGGRDAQQTK